MNIPQLQLLNDKISWIYSLKLILKTIIQNNLNIDIDINEIEVNRTQDLKFGDLTTNVALKLSQQVGKTPREIGELLSVELQDQTREFISKVEIAGPGFLNFFIHQARLIEELDIILSKNKEYGKWNIAKGQVMVEFGQPNTHKAFHVGHLKSAITGLSLARLISNLGYEVLQANFYGDVGMNVAKTVWGFIKKGYPEGFEKLDIHIRMKYIDSCYVAAAKAFKEDKDTEAEIRDINTKLYLKSDSVLNKIYDQTKNWSLEHLNDAFYKLGVKYDRQYPESEVSEIGINEVKKHIGDIFIEDEGSIIIPGAKFGISTWVFITKEGNPTYSAKDLGLAIKKFAEYPDLVFNLTATSVEQNNYFSGIIKAFELTYPEKTGKFYHLGFGWMLRGGKKFSSRMGNTIKGIEVIEESKAFALQKVTESKTYSSEEANIISNIVSIAGLKFLILSHEIHKDISYDPEEFLNPEGFSGPYILYAYVRAKSILRQDEKKSFHISNLNINLNTDEINLLKLLQQFPQITLQAGKSLTPHIIAFYLFELAQAFNKFYNENKVLVDDEDIRTMRLKLVEATSIVLKNGLNLLGIETIEQM